MSARFRAPIAAARGLGSAGGGTQHFWVQRLTAVALVPLTLWFVVALVSLVSADYEAVRAWFASPITAVLWIALIVATFHHAQLGVQVVIEDYVHAHWLKIASLMALKLAALFLAAVCVVAVLKLALGD